MNILKLEQNQLDIDENQKKLAKLEQELAQIQQMQAQAEAEKQSILGKAIKADARKAAKIAQD